MIAVDGGLAFAVNAPKKLDSTFAAPTERKSALMSVSNPNSGGCSGCRRSLGHTDNGDRQRGAIVSSMESNVSGGKVRLGSPDLSGPSVWTPRALRSKIADVAMARTRTTSAPGNDRQCERR